MPQEEIAQDNDRPEGSEPAESEPSRESDTPSRVGAILHQPLTRIQALVGVCAGLITITGSVLSLTGFTTKGPVPGEIVAVVQDARARTPLVDATVEILTPQDALVTTLTAPDNGRVERRLKEGKYRLRVSHPQFASQVRYIEVAAGERSEIHVALAPRPSPPVAAAPPAPPPVPAAPATKSAPHPKTTHVAKTTHIAKPAPATKPAPAAPASEPATKPVPTARSQRQESGI